MKKSLGVFIAILSLGVISEVTAQPGGSPSGSPAPFGFVELLIGAGALYGGKKAWDKKKERL